MLTGLRVQNFKSWRDTGEFRLAPITVLFGANSSGKTSLIQFLLMLRQTAESTDRRRVLDLGDPHALVDLGSFRDVVFSHDVTRALSFTVTWEPARIDFVKDMLPDVPPHTETVSFDAQIRQVDQETIAVEEFGYRIGDEYFHVARRNQGTYASTSIRHSKHRGLGSPTKFYRFPPARRPAMEGNALAGLEFELESMLSGISHVGPMREAPRRNYLWTGTTPSEVGQAGEHAVETLIAARITGETAEESSIGYPDSLQPKFGRWLRDMGVVDSFELRELAPGRRIYEVVVRTRPDSPEVLLTDVGFGVSQLLPVLVQSFNATKGSTVLFEQPEIHLHPSVQSHLADVFIDAAKTQGVQFLVESHSEHLLRRLQRRIADGTVTSDDVALYFVDYGPTGSSLRALELDESGNIKNWPEGFFGDDVADIAAVARATAQRRLQDARERESP